MKKKEFERLENDRRNSFDLLVKEDTFYSQAERRQFLSKKKDKRTNPGKREESRDKYLETACFLEKKQEKKL